MRLNQLGLAFGVLVTATAVHAADVSDYERLYPTYAEFCAGSQISKAPGFGLDVEGRIGGHGVIYLKGACRDRDASYPKIRICDPEKDAGVEQGVAVSVDSDFKNVNWVAVGSKQFFIRGDLEADERLTQDAYSRTEEKAEAMDLFHGVEYHPEVLATAPDGMSPSEFMYEDAAGTDYALSFGRTLHCARVPLPLDRLAQAVDFLNSLNEKYRTQDYNLDFIYDNCTHTTHNALAAAGVWDEVETDQFIAIQAFNLAIPLNNYVELMERGNNLPLEDLSWLYRDVSARKALLEGDWLPTQHGVLAEVTPIVQQNDVYFLNLSSLLLDVPVIEPVQHMLDKFSTDARYLDVRANLEYFLKRYAKLKADKKPAWIYWTRFQDGSGHFKAGFDKDEFERFHTKFYQWLDRQIADAKVKLAQTASR